MDWLGTAAWIVACWIALSLVLVVTWGRFMDHLARKEREVARGAISDAPTLELVQTAA